jgi:hypothetical protein
MQLDLFCDNRRTIRLNETDELLRCLLLDEALAVYGEPLTATDAAVERIHVRAVHGKDAGSRGRDLSA